MCVFFVRSIINRLNVVSENTLLLAAEQPLKQMVAGSDEIRKLDEVLHRVAGIICTARAKERAVVENASDIICKIDGQGKFSSINPASSTLWGYAPDELIGKQFSQVVESQDGSNLLRPKVHRSVVKCRITIDSRS